MASCVPGNGYAAVVGIPLKRLKAAPNKRWQDYARLRFPMIPGNGDHFSVGDVCMLLIFFSHELNIPGLVWTRSIASFKLTCHSCHGHGQSWIPPISGNTNNPSFTKLYLSFYSIQYITGSTYIYIYYTCTHTCIYIYIYCYRCYIYIISYHVCYILYSINVKL